MRTVPSSDAYMCDGGGFPAFWHCMGSGHAIGPHRYVGWSSGAIAAVLLVTIPQITFTELVRAALDTRHAVHLGFGRLRYGIEHFLDALLPKDAHSICNGALEIILCDPRKLFCARIETFWSTREQLIGCVVASSWVPGFVGMRFTDPLYGCMDGGFCLNLWTVRKTYLRMHKSTLHNSSFLGIFKPISESHARDLYDAGTYASIVNL